MKRSWSRRTKRHKRHTTQSSHLTQRLYRQHTHRRRLGLGISSLAHRGFFEERANNLRPSHREVGDRFVNNHASPQGVHSERDVGHRPKGVLRDDLPCSALELGEAAVRRFGNTGEGRWELWS